MRIRSGGPSQTKASEQTGKAGSVQKSSGTKFSGLVDKAGSSTDDRASQGKNHLMQELAALADELEQGTATKEEASRKFVGMVIRERFGKQKGKGAQTMEDAVGDLVEADPSFVSKLQSQLKRIAKG